MLHIVDRGRLRRTARNAERQRQRSVHGGAPPTRSHTGRPVAAGSPGQLLLAAHKPLYDLGIDGWWPDQGDGLDGPSQLARIRMYWEGRQQWRPNERPFALHRNGYAGMWRYGAFLWSGDVYSHVGNAEDARARWRSTPGSPGFPSGARTSAASCRRPSYTGELHVRWFQFGAFCPLFRAHGRDWHLRLPWGWNTGELGPNEVANFGAGPPDVGAAQRRRRADLPQVPRAALPADAVPLLGACANARRPACRSCARCGCITPTIPSRHSAAISTSGDATCSSRRSSRRARRSRKLYLPRGTWFDFWTEQSHERRPRARSARRSRDDAALRARRRHPADGAGQAVHGRDRRTLR